MKKSSFFKLRFLGILLTIGQLFSTIANAGITDMKVDFLEGEVELISFNVRITKFRIVTNDAVVEVRNDIHLRLVENPYLTSKVFPIIAPMTAVDVVEGSVPASYIQKHSLKYYLALREKYEAGESLVATPLIAENILSKSDTDYIFGLTLPEWEDYAKRMIHPYGWEVRLFPQESGTGVLSSDPVTGMTLTTQPMYGEYREFPDALVIGTYYSPGTLPAFTVSYKKKLEKEILEDLGSAYKVSASYAELPPLEGVAIIVIKKQKENGEIL